MLKYNLRVLFLVIVLSFSKSTAYAYLSQRAVTHFSFPVEEDFYGVWDCEVKGAVPEYQRSTLFITMEEKGSPSVIVQLSNGSIKGQNVRIEDTTISFDMNIEGVERVTVILKHNNGTLKGKVITTEGDLIVNCLRKYPPK